MNDLLKSILDGIHTLIPSYGWSLVAFTLLIKLCLLPLDYKSRKGMRKMSALAPKQAELQKKYGHDQEKLNRKLQELYKKEGASPMSGCWPMLLTMPILFAMFAAMRYMANEQLVQQAFDILIYGEPVLEPFLWIKNLWMPDSPFAAAWPNLTSLQAVEEKQWLAIFSTLTTDEIAALASAINLPDLSAAAFSGSALKETISAIGSTLTALPAYVEQTSVVPYLQVNLLITNLAVVTGCNGFFILPLLSACSQFFMTKVTGSAAAQPAPAANDEKAQQQQSTTNFMKWFFPIFSLWICSSSTAGFALYWVVTNLFSLVSNLLINRHLDRQEKLAKETAADDKFGMK